MLVGLTAAARFKSDLLNKHLVHKPAVCTDVSIARGMGLVDNT